MPNKTDVVAALATGGGFLGAITFTDVYQAMSFLVLTLTAIHWVLRIKKQLKDD